MRNSPIETDGSTACPGDVYGQTYWCLEVVHKAIQGAGGQLDDAIRVMFTDISRWEEAAKAHGEFFSDIRPACTFVEVSRFIKEDWLMEIESDCAVS